MIGQLRWPLQVAVAAATLVALSLAPFHLDPGPLYTLGRVLIVGLLAASLDLLVGGTGLPSLGHAAYFAIGGYAAGLLAEHVTTNGPLQFVVAVAAALLVAAATGWLVVRTRGITFLMLTLALGQIVANLATTWDSVTEGSNGLVVPPVTVLPGGAPIVQPADRYWYVLAGFTIAFTLLALVAASPFGHALRGIRDNEARMRAVGYSTFWFKYAAFCVAGAVAGAAGGLSAAHGGLVSPADASLELSIVAIVAVVIGGAGSLWGPCVGAGVVFFVRDTIGIHLEGHGTMLLGAVFIAAVYLLPRGVAGIRLRIGASP